MKFIPLMSPSIPESAVEAVAAVLRSGMLVQGENVSAFEKEIGEYLDVRNVVAVSNGTASLHLALMALGIGQGDEVIVPAFSYIATANVVEVVGATCVFVDIDPDTFNIDVDRVEAKITARTKAIIPVHEFGLACDIGRLAEIAKRHDIAVIEDAACALGAKENGHFAGTVGEAGSFSLHPRKAVTSGEGGLLVTDDDRLARKFRILRNHGIDPEGEGMHFVGAGLNYRMTDFQAALVRPQFKSIDENLAAKQKLADAYFEILGSDERITLPAVPSGKKHTWQTFHIVLDDAINRNEFIGKMKASGVGTNFGAQCIPDQIYFKEKYAIDCAREFPNAFRAAQQGLALPIYEKLTVDDIRYIAEATLTNLDS
jgi:dTDP-4-amino-4,6-dideoxygalactose transaminase